MYLEILLAAVFLHRSIASRLRIIQIHGLFEKFKSLHFLDCLFGSLYTVKDNEGLTFCFQIGFCDKVDYVAIFGEYFGESLF